MRGWPGRNRHDRPRWGALRFGRLFGAVTLLWLGACAEPGPLDPSREPPDPSPEPPLDPSPELPPPPGVELTLAFGEAPLEGQIFLMPAEESSGWRYSVDVDEDGAPDHEGVLERRIGFTYRFRLVGVHRLTTTFRRKGRTETVESLVVVNDMGAVQILAATQVEPVDPMARSYEGIAVSRSGEDLYVAAYRGGSLQRLDARSLSETGRIEDIGYSIEGLSITPSGRFLFATYKYWQLTVVDLDDFEVVDTMGSVGRFYIHALDDRRALVGGEDFALVDPSTGKILQRFQPVSNSGEFPYTWHFAVSPDASTAAVVVIDDPGWVELIDVETFQTLRRVRFGRLEYPRLVSFDPSGTVLYVIGRMEGGGISFAAFDLDAGEILRETPLGDSEGICSLYCVANPTATFPDRKSVV